MKKTKKMVFIFKIVQTLQLDTHNKKVLGNQVHSNRNGIFVVVVVANQFGFNLDSQDLKRKLKILNQIF